MSWRTIEWGEQSIGRRGEILTRHVFRCGFCRGTGVVSTKRK